MQGIILHLFSMPICRRVGQVVGYFLGMKCQRDNLVWKRFLAFCWSDCHYFYLKLKFSFCVINMAITPHMAARTGIGSDFFSMTT
jgi:hypothetical protein